MKFLMGTLILVLLSGCASMSKDECSVADWHQVGYNDGGNGHPRARMEEHARACTQAGIAVDRTRYLGGHDQGLLHYCTPATGYRMGREGRHYADVCPIHLAPGFLEPYRHGREIHLTHERIDKLERARRELEHKLASAKSDDERRRLRNDLLDIDYNLRRARDRLIYLERGYVR